MRRGILLGDNGEGQVKVVRDSSGLITQGLVVGESDYSHIRLIVESSQGDFKDCPVLGI